MKCFIIGKDSIQKLGTIHPVILKESIPASYCPLRLDQIKDAFIIHQYLHTMEEPYKEVFSLRVFGELPFEKIGRLFGKSSGWARVTYHRARKQIMKYMEAMNNGKD